MTEDYIAKIVHNKIETQILISADNPAVLVIENPKEFYNLVNELKEQFEGREGDFLLLKGDCRLSFETKADFVLDVFSLDFCSKKVTNALHKYLEKLSQDDNLQFILSSLNSTIAEYFGALFDKISIGATYDEIGIQELLHSSKVRAMYNYESILEKIICYINIIVQLKGINFVAFLHLKSILSEDEILKLYKHCRREKVGLLLIESSIKGERLDGERRVIITDDLCEIVDGNIIEC